MEDAHTDKRASIAANQPSGRLQSLRANLDEHVFFWITVLVALYIFFAVPQVKNVWQQRPPLEGGFWTMLGYLLFLSFLIGFYGVSMFVVMCRCPVRSVQLWAEEIITRRRQEWHELGRRRFYRPSYWFACVTWRAPDLCSRWLVGAVINPQRLRKAPKVAVGILVVVLVGSAGLLFGTHADASRSYPLAGAFCQTMALYCLAAVIWLLWAIPHRIRGAEQPGEVCLYAGRFIAWLISTAVIGEVLWVLAYTGWWDNLISYRLYTIWAIFQVLTTLVISGLLIDRWHVASEWIPVRHIAIVLLPVLVWLFTRALPVDARELERHLSRDQIRAWRTLCKEKDGPHTPAWHTRSNAQWFHHINSRVQEIPESEPVVIVAASGGGSRAAIFTALVLETLARTPIGKDSSTSENGSSFIHEHPAGKKRTWADNIVLISSVSGGSLATAHHVATRSPLSPPERLPPSPHTGQRILRNTAPVELLEWGFNNACELIRQYLDKPPQGFPVELFRDYYQDDRRRDDPRAAVAALVAAEPAIRQLLDKLGKQRAARQAELTQPNTPMLANPEEVAQELARLSETANTLRTALALLAGYQSLASPVAAPLGKWIWSSRAFDEMCVDFMAPLVRGALTPSLDRGDALARFWTHRFGWKNCTNFSGYHGPVTDWNYNAYHPAVVFNAVDVARGSRLAIGFPPLPSDLWDGVYQRGVTREVPRPLNAPVSLARAVRMSSNFPFGFRAMQLQSPARIIPDAAAALKPARRMAVPVFETVHVLDGGVVDNTGLDTIYELLLAVEYHADAKNRSAYQAEAARLLENLRRRGVCVLEIDAGAKPNIVLPGRFDLLGGITEQKRALENGGYSNADRVKQLYLKEIRRILTQRLDEPGHLLTEVRTSLRDLEDGLPPTALHYCFQCNHYQPGQGSDPAIMTAWALGPRDKAEVVARFLPELGVWDERRQDLSNDITSGKDGVARARQVARLRVLLDRVDDLSQAFYRLSLNLASIEALAREAKPVPPDRLAQLRKEFGQAKGQFTALAPEVARETDSELRKAWAELETLAGMDDKRLALIEDARSAREREELQAKLRSQPNLAQQSRKSFAQIRTNLQDAEADVNRKVRARLKQRQLCDPQMQYDQLNRQGKEVWEKRPSPHES